VLRSSVVVEGAFSNSEREPDSWGWRRALQLVSEDESLAGGV
jgi:hypothetical protein